MNSNRDAKDTGVSFYNTSKDIPKGMVKKVHIDDKVYEINCEFGTQDVVWLAINACYLHGKVTVPISRYTPILALNSKDEYLHPRLTIGKYNGKIGDEISVRIRHEVRDEEDELSQDERKWISQAFRTEKFLMNVKIIFTPMPEYRLIDTFYIRLKHEIYQPLIYFQEYRQDDFIEVALNKADKGQIYMASKEIPYGSITMTKIFYV